MSEENITPEELDGLAEKTVEFFKKDDPSWVIKTKCLVHDAKEVKRYKNLGMSEEPPTKKVDYAFHLSDVEDVTQHFMQLDEESDYEEVTIIQKFSGKTVPVTMPFEDVAERFFAFHEDRDRFFRNKEQQLSL